MKVLPSKKPDPETSDPSPSPSPSPSDPASPASSTTDPFDTSHFDDIDPAIDDAAGTDAPGDAGPSPAPASDLLTRDQFFTAFCAIFAAPNILILAQGQPHLDSLVIDRDDAAARAASNALYDTCADVPWLRWLIQPENVWLQRAAAIGLFGYQRYQLVRMELSSRVIPTPRDDGERSEAHGGPPPAGADEIETVLIDGQTFHQAKTS